MFVSIKLNQKYLVRGRKYLIEACNQIMDTDEFKSCELAIENNISHNKESVREHTMYVFERLQDFLTLKFIKSDKCQEKAKGYFSGKIGRWSRVELFLISALLHDLGKVATLTVDENGETRSSGHEEESVRVAKKILERFSYEQEEIEYLLNVIKLHSGYKLRILDFLDNLSDEQLKSALGSVLLLPEVFMYMIADNENASIFGKYKRIIEDKFLQVGGIYKTGFSLEDADKLGNLMEKIVFHLKLNSKPWPIETRLFHLSEEVGELHDIYLQCVGAKDREQSVVDIQNALNDVLLETLALYDIYGINIKNSLEKILKENE